jgi:L-ascorbate metabolism protein UlaG (beta-lactamase superfamily)
MRLTKFGHSCVRLEKDGRSLVIDPGNFSDVEAALAGCDAILVTHEHADHIDPDRVLPWLDAAEAAELHAPDSVVRQLRSHGAVGGAGHRIRAVEPESSLSVAGFDIRTFGGQHALIHPHVRIVDNVGYLIDGNVYHPGDSFIVPHGAEVRTLLVPLHAPWSKTAEVIDFVVSVRAGRAFPIHDALLNERGISVAEKHVGSFGAAYGTDYQRWGSGETREV